MVTVFGKKPLNEVIRAKWRYRLEPSQYDWYLYKQRRRNKKNTQPSARHEDFGETKPAGTFVLSFQLLELEGN